MSVPRWLRLVLCWFNGHNLVGLDLPPGWSEQTCRTCGRQVRAFRRPV